MVHYYSLKLIIYLNLYFRSSTIMSLNNKKREQNFKRRMYISKGMKRTNYASFGFAPNRLIWYEIDIKL